MNGEAWSDKKLGATTATAIRKIESILPEKLKKEIQLETIQVPGFRMTQALSDNLERVRKASDESTKLDIRYCSISGEETSRVIWPLILFFWGNKWTVGAWCELRDGFRSF
ncbi:MAG: WYL domain-containing protein [Pseudomonadales bacterium]